MTRFSTRRYSALAIAAVAAFALPVAASAAPKAASADTSAFEQQATTAKSQRYCVVETLTGSHIQTRTCKSLDAWLADGFDPRAKN